MYLICLGKQFMTDWIIPKQETICKQFKSSKDNVPREIPQGLCACFPIMGNTARTFMPSGHSKSSDKTCQGRWLQKTWYVGVRPTIFQIKVQWHLTAAPKKRGVFQNMSWTKSCGKRPALGTTLHKKKAVAQKLDLFMSIFSIVWRQVPLEISQDLLPWEKPVLSVITSSDKFLLLKLWTFLR